MSQNVNYERGYSGCLSAAPISYDTGGGGDDDDDDDDDGQDVAAIKPSLTRPLPTIVAGSNILVMRQRNE